MKRIISVSRRTDVPAFYGDWFMACLNEGFAGVVNPFGGQKYIVSLRPQDVVCFMFWSKNFAPFLENLEAINRMGYKFYFNYTVTGLPKLCPDAVLGYAVLKFRFAAYPRGIDPRYRKTSGKKKQQQKK